MPRPEPVEGQLTLPWRRTSRHTEVRLKPDTTYVGGLVFVRHPKARRYVIRVIEDGTVRVTLPRWGSKREAAQFVARERQWIEKEQRRVQALSPSPAGPDQRDRSQHPRPRQARVADPVARTGRATRPRGLAHQRQESTVAVGIVFTERPHLPELAPRGHARDRSRLRDDPRTDALEAAGPLAALLEARRRGVSRLSGRAKVAQDLSPRLKTRRMSMPSSGSLRRPRMWIGIALPPPRRLNSGSTTFSNTDLKPVCVCDTFASISSWP